MAWVRWKNIVLNEDEQKIEWSTRKSIISPESDERKKQKSWRRIEQTKLKKIAQNKWTWKHFRKQKLNNNKTKDWDDQSIEKWQRWLSCRYGESTQ